MQHPRVMRAGVAVLWLLSFCIVLVAAQAPPVESPTTGTQPSASPVANEDAISVYFSPKGGCTEAIVQEIERARDTVCVQAYSFTSAPIAKAITDAHKRGVKVTAVLDASNRTAQYSAPTFLFNVGVPVFIDSNHAIAHNKIILLDGKTIITGSFNFSKAAEESNAENLLVIKDKPALFAAFQRNFQQHLAHSVQYHGKLDTSPGNTRGPPASGPTVAPAHPTTREAAHDAVTVYVTKSGKKYHREGCPYLSKSSIPIGLEAAKAKGFTPCTKCSPPE